MSGRDGNLLSAQSVENTCEGGFGVLTPVSALFPHPHMTHFGGLWGCLARGSIALNIRAMEQRATRRCKRLHVFGGYPAGDPAGGNS